MTGEDYEARKDEHRPDWPGYDREGLPVGHPSRDLRYWHEGFEAGLTAARDAVPHEISCWGSESEPCDCFHASVVAAIDALKGKA